MGDPASPAATTRTASGDPGRLAAGSGPTSTGWMSRRSGSYRHSGPSTRLERALAGQTDLSRGG